MVSPGERSPVVSSAAAAKRRRVLACVLCQQRKIKCDRKFPCENCNKNGIQCMPAAPAARQRRRRFPERDLLERLRHYEVLLRQNNIKFDPLHTSVVENTSPRSQRRDHDSTDNMQPEGREEGSPRQQARKKTVKSGTINIWHAMNQRCRTPMSGNDTDNESNDEDYGSDFSHAEVRHATVNKALNHLYEEGDDQLLFGSRKADINLSTLHPEQVQIFRLWQIYLDNVSPLLKVTHTPTLQPRIIDAAGHIASINPPLEALMFSIYCISTLSLSDADFRASFGLERKGLLTSYQYGCQQALLRCRILRSSDRDCLTALYLYLLSIRCWTNPRSLSSMLGVAIRIAQHMGIHSEFVNSKYNAFEAEMRRRLWWALAIFDSRVSEMSDSKATILVPTWDCKTPLDTNDFDLRPEMKSPPAHHGSPTEATFAVVRSEVADVLRNSAFYLDFINPTLRPLAKDAEYRPTSESGELTTLERMTEDRYFKLYNPENPLHFMTMWTIRGYLAKNRLFDHYSRYARSLAEQTDAQRDIAVCYALSMFECDTKLMTSTLTRGYQWAINLQFPFPAYIHIVQDLRRRPFGKHAENAWQLMSDNYEARLKDTSNDEDSLSKILSKVIFQAWAARYEAFDQATKPEVPPRIVSAIKNKLSQMTPGLRNGSTEQVGKTADIGDDCAQAPMHMDFGGPGPQSSFGSLGPTYVGLGGFPDIPGQSTMEADMNQLNWGAIDWNPMRGYGW